MMNEDNLRNEAMKKFIHTVKKSPDEQDKDVIEEKKISKGDGKSSMDLLSEVLDKKSTQQRGTTKKETKRLSENRKIKDVLNNLKGLFKK